MRWNVTAYVKGRGGDFQNGKQLLGKQSQKRGTGGPAENTLFLPFGSGRYELFLICTNISFTSDSLSCFSRGPWCSLRREAGALR